MGDREEQKENTYVIRPAFRNKFRPSVVKAMMKQLLEEKLKDKTYHSENTSNWTREIADELKQKLKDLELDRYKFVVQVVIGEQRGEGVKMGCRCFWDSDTDNYAQEVFLNDSLFCVVAAYGVYYY
eukprot:TRINITY_DN7506_c0_g1_i1.p1 TRINITY_DN7506_c0_g1~~TRINITY_DN7506_c0_g1_i1.p1  ORF type:complete len:126 (+),score=14.00 TRINITY_DN7506_c0_g1_i1:245-622(+)